ncbi:MAG TPA: response regulator transcription factor [Solirubrobacterales bacterium]|jgi:DNA-binding NarL/FixJ family response regulator|nr:response regulator transcription factor [Solirubrobacterales bacterium]
MRTTVLIVDDHAGFRASARRLLETEGYAVVAEAPDATSALAMAAEHQPQLALVDIQLPDFDGFELASRMAALDHPPAVVLISSRDRIELEPLIGDSEARGFLSKSVLSKQALEKLV